MAVGRLQRSYFTSHARAPRRPRRPACTHNAEPVLPFLPSSLFVPPPSPPFLLPPPPPPPPLLLLFIFSLRDEKEGGKGGSIAKNSTVRPLINRPRCKRSFLSPVSRLSELVERIGEGEGRARGERKGREERSEEVRTVGARIRQLRHGNVTDDRSENGRRRDV